MKLLSKAPGTNEKGRNLMHQHHQGSRMEILEGGSQALALALALG